MEDGSDSEKIGRKH